MNMSTKKAHAQSVRESSPQCVPALIRAFESGETSCIPARMNLTKEEEYLTQIAFLKKAAKELENRLRDTELDLRATRKERDYAFGERDKAFEQMVRTHNI
eukprot:9135071-Pyramimonas_sp.AAC.2